MDERVVGGVAAIIAYIMWRRGIAQNAWAALWGSSDRAALPTGNQQAVMSLITAGGEADTAATKTANVANSVPSQPVTGDVVDANGNAIIAAEPAGTAAVIKQYGTDFWDLCLAWVNKTRQAAGLPIGVYGDPTAQDACNSLQLHPGVAPRGASVCFNDNHIGIANGGDSYTSAGLVHGGVVTRSYVGNPAYTGWSL